MSPFIMLHIFLFLLGGGWVCVLKGLHFVQIQQYMCIIISIDLLV